MYWKLAPYIGVLLLGWVLNGWRLSERYERLGAEFGRYKLSAESARADTEAKYRQIEKDAQSRVNLAIQSYREEQQNAQLEKDKRNIDIASGARRLYVNTTIPACTGGMPKTGRDSTRPTETARAELDATTARRIVSYTDEGDDAIRQLDALIAACRKP